MADFGQTCQKMAKITVFGTGSAVKVKEEGWTPIVDHKYVQVMWFRPLTIPAGDGISDDSNASWVDNIAASLQNYA